MNKWNCIPETRVLDLNVSDWTLSFPGGSYRLYLLRSEPEWVQVSYGQTTERWPIEVKEENSSGYRLSGFAWETPEIMVESSTWFELLISNQTQVTYWADRVVYRVDIGC